MSDFTLAQVIETIYDQLASLLADCGISRSQFSPATNLIDDLGLDSLKFVDLNLALEEAFGLEEFPMQEWVDAEAANETPAFTVLSLARACVSELERAGGSAMSLDGLPSGLSDFHATETWSRRLYERAKRDQWTLGEAVDPTLLRLDDLPRSVHGAVRHIYTQVRWGEVLALTMTARLVDASPSIGIKMFGATQMMDEARHVEFFTQLVGSLGEIEAPGPAMAAFADELRRVRDIDEILLASQVILEGYAKCLFVEGANAGERAAVRRIRLPGSPDPRPLLAAISRYIGGDESRHVAFGVLFLKERLRSMGVADRRRLEDSAHAWKAAMEGVIGETEPSLVRVGIDLPKLRQRVRRTQAAHFRHMGLDT